MKGLGYLVAFFVVAGVDYECVRLGMALANRADDGLFLAGLLIGTVPIYLTIILIGMLCSRAYRRIAGGH